MALLNQKIAAALFAFALCLPAHGQTIDMPPSWRAANYGGGSCGHATIATLLRWSANPELANWWLYNYSGGVTSNHIDAFLTGHGIPFYKTSRYDPAFLDRCIGRGLPVGISWPLFSRRHPQKFVGWHMLTLVDLDQNQAVILDNNHPATYRHLTRSDFLNRWRICESNEIFAYALALPAYPPKVRK